MKHIAFITKGFPKDDQDSTRMPSIHLYVKALKQYHPRLKVSVITLHYPLEQGTYQWNNVDVHALGVPIQMSLSKIRAWPDSLKRLKSIHRDHPIDLMHSFMLNDSALLGHRFGRKFGVPHVCTNIGMELVDKNHYIKLMPVQTMPIVCLSAFQEKLLMHKCNRRATQLIPYGIERPNEQVTAQERKTDLLFVGNLNENKGVIDFLQTLKQLKTGGRTLKAKIIGDNIRSLNVEQLIHEHDLNKGVQYLGRLPNQRVLEEMSQSKILLHTAQFESQGYVFLEALSRGMYIISRAVGIAKKSSRWHLADNIEGFAAAAETILTAEREHTAMIPYSMHETLDQHMALYDSLIENHKKN